MKKYFRFTVPIFCAVLIAMPHVGSAQALVNIILHQPPPNKLRIADLWSVTLTNASKNTISIYLHGIATETKSGKVIVDAQTHPFPLAPGSITPTGSQLGTIKVNSSDPNYRDIMLQTGTLPTGDYTECVYVISATDGSELGSDCVDLHVENFSPPVLISPTDGAEVDEPIPVFTWVPPVPMIPGAQVSYRLHITEILSRQTPYEAFTQNNVWFDETGITGTVMQYPVSARSFETDKMYAWQVTAYLNGLSIGESEVWSFRRTGVQFIVGNLSFKPTFPVHGAVGGLAHTASVANDSSVYTWGDNSANQLGVAAPGGSPIPVAVPNLKSIKAVAAGGMHTLAVTYAGKLYAWGNNEYGQLGDNSFTSRTAPVMTAMYPLTDTIAAGNLISIALTKDGSVYQWGYDRTGEFPGGKIEDSLDINIPLFVPGMNGIVAISAGFAHGLALTAKGAVYGWGNNDYWQTGYGASMRPPLKPYLVSGLPATTTVHVAYVRPIQSIAAGSFHSLALAWDGTVWAWGDNSSGQLGDGSRISRSAPVAIPGLTDIIAIAAGGTHSMALRKDSTVWVWGGNQWSMLGLGANDSMHTVPVQIPGVTKVVHISCGEGHSFLVMSDGALYGWGENTYGQVGNGDRSDPNKPAATDPVKATLVKK